MFSAHPADPCFAATEMRQPWAVLPRTLEPEVMDSEEEALAYDEMDHAGVNAAFCVDLLAGGPVAGARVVDLGTGTALIPIELARREPTCTITAVDLAAAMLRQARHNIARAGVTNIELCLADAKSMATGPAPEARYDVVMSNSLVHHIADPTLLFQTMLCWARTGARLFVRDLLRPTSTAEVDRLVERYAAPRSVGHLPEAQRAGAKARDDQQRELFRASLHAALTLEEVRRYARAGGLKLEDQAVRATSDRHWTLECTLDRVVVA
jgi:ubiquinone/menaquinone biosynthesis C-methylase UbiE